MRVDELVAILQKLPQDATVFVGDWNEADRTPIPLSTVDIVRRKVILEDSFHRE